MKTTYYFKTHVMPKRPYLRMEWLERAAQSPLKQVVQPDGRIRTWIYVEGWENTYGSCSWKMAV